MKGQSRRGQELLDQEAGISNWPGRGREGGRGRRRDRDRDRDRDRGGERKIER
jgi:hypothetical protein